MLPILYTYRNSKKMTPFRHLQSVDHWIPSLASRSVILSMRIISHNIWPILMSMMLLSPYYDVIVIMFDIGHSCCTGVNLQGKPSLGASQAEG